MARSRLWRFLMIFFILYLVVLFLFLHSFSSDTNTTPITSPLPHGDVKISESNNELKKVPDEIIIKKEEIVLPNNEPKKLPDQIIIKKEEISLSGLEPVMTKDVLGNYEPKNLDKSPGPGEDGEGVQLKEEAEKKQGDESVDKYGFNEVASDKISLDRRARDTRPEECKHWNYPNVDKLPTASVILVFYDEGWSTLVRTFHSVINTSPKELLKDIILVDDYSDDEHITVRLPEYIKKWNGLVKYVRTEKRVGLVEARVVGARAGAGDVIVILDAHCECVTNWLPPLLTRIALNRKTLAVPIVDGIEWNTLQHNPAYFGETRFRGIWEWGFLYKETEIPERERNKMKYPTEPYKSPTHAGGLLAIEKKWFFELGGYDPDIKIWGGEQYELSFKVWMCGGQLEWVTCSHVGHIYRGPRRRSMHPKGGNLHQSHINHMRVAEIWMDEYKVHYLRRRPNHAHLDMGDTSKYKALRQSLNCSSFKWFLDEVAYDMADKYPLPPGNLVWGEMRNDQFNEWCADKNDNNFGRPIGISGCHGQGGNQMFRLNIDGEWSLDEHCFISEGDNVVSRHCVQMGKWIPKGEWIYDNQNGQMRSTKTDKCVTTDSKRLFLEGCQSNNTAQKWTWKEVYVV